MKWWHVIVGVVALEALLVCVVALVETWRADRMKGREVRCLPWAEADRLLRLEEGWRIAPEEDRNTVLGSVWLERPVVEDGRR